MSLIKSVADLKRIREEVQQKRQQHSGNHIQVIVGMGSPSIAAGARETQQAILSFIEEHQLTNIDVRQTGNIGWDSYEPIVQVIIGNKPKVSYGKVTPQAAQRILKEHVLGGHVVEEYLIKF